MLKHLRTISLILIIAPLSAMFIEPFFEKSFDILGLDSENWAAPTLQWFHEHRPWLTFLLGVGVGIWGYSFAQKRTVGPVNPTEGERGEVSLAVSRESADNSFTTISNNGVSRYYWDLGHRGNTGILLLVFKRDTGTDRVTLTDLKGRALPYTIHDKSNRSLVLGVRPSAIKDGFRFSAQGVDN
ncbi:MAG: hypothetical protein GY945_00475 [Rhodobacteraceae bacterium]|nr:hypothetical protein [Paracoccaceae bacterium]